VLDEWFVEQALPRMKGRCFIIRYADDFIIGCELGSDAKRIMNVLPKRFNEYFGVRSNYKALEVVFEFIEKAWRFWLSRRSHKGGISWAKFEKIRTSFVLPKPRIVHNNI